MTDSGLLYLHPVYAAALDVEAATEAEHGYGSQEHRAVVLVMADLADDLGSPRHAGALRAWAHVLGLIAGGQLMQCDRKCVICGRAFRPYHSGHTHCSRECQQEQKRRCWRRWYAVPANRKRHSQAALQSYHRRRRGRSTPAAESEARPGPVDN